jgi:hypothetical protein
MDLARYLAGVGGRAHGRQMGSGQRRAWHADLAKNHKAALDAPSSARTVKLVVIARRFRCLQSCAGGKSSLCALPKALGRVDG